MSAPLTLAPLSLALWAMDYSRTYAGLDAWLAHIESGLARAKSEGAQLLMLPEYCSMPWLSFTSGLLADTTAQEASVAQQVLAALPALVRKHGVALLAGTFPVKEGDHFYNRCHFIREDGSVVVQDKMRFIPAELSMQGMVASDVLQIFAWQGYRCAILICFDVQQTSLIAQLQQHDIDILFVPSQTAKLSGYHRVFDAAKARAIEMYTVVPVVGGVGTCVYQAGGQTLTDTNVSAASVFGPCEERYGFTGRFAHAEPVQGTANGEGVWLLARDLPVAEISALRRGHYQAGAEVWRGAWPGNIKVKN